MQRKRIRKLAGNRKLAAESLEIRNLMASLPLQVSIENLSPVGGLVATPVWVGFHNGQFEVGKLSRPASEFPGLELLAEEGQTSAISTRFHSASTGADATIGAPGGFAGAPVIEPGEIAKQTINVEDTRTNRYFSFASMVVPSNDAFVGNLNSREYELFDRAGNFRGPISINVDGSEVWDAGTEVNVVKGGAAFSTEGGTSTDEHGVIARHPGLDNFIGSGLPTGSKLASAFRSQTPLYRITISRADRPSAPIDRTGPTATLEASDILTTSAASHNIRVIYADPSGVDVSRIGTNDLQIFGRNGRRLNVASVTTNAVPGVLSRTVVATYTIAAGDGSFDFDDNSRYSIELLDSTLRDLVNNPNRYAKLGEISVDVGIGLQVSIENLSPLGGVAETPFWVALHDGGFEVGREGKSASAFQGLELIAETGNTSELSNRFKSTSSGIDTTIGAPGGFAGAPVFEPGESALRVIDVRNPGQNRYFSYASMIIPSNDAFVANLNSRETAVFDRAGNFRGPITIEIYGRDVYDAGTEVNNPKGGAAFSTEGGTSVDENGTILPSKGLNDFIGTGLPTGSTLKSAFIGQTPLARLTISLAKSPSQPIDKHGPEAVLDASNLTIAAPFHEIRITFSDPSGVDVSRIGTDNLTIVGRNGRLLKVLSVATDNTPGTNPRTVTATYRIAGAKGSFANADNSRYTVELRHNAIGDLVGNHNTFKRLGEFTIGVV